MNFIYFYFEIAALIAGVWKYKNAKGTPFALLIWLIGLVVLAEMIGMYLRRVLHVPNVKVYNIATLVEFMAYGWIFLEIINWKRFSLFGKGFLVLYPLCWLVNVLFIQGFAVFHTYTMTIGSICMVIMSFSYLYTIFRADTNLNLPETPAFWFVMGILFFYSGDMLNSFLLKYTHKIKITDGFSLFRLINTTLNIILYSSFIKAFQCLPKKNK